MSSSLAYLVYLAMTSGLSSVSFYAVDTNNNNHPFNVLVPSTNTYYYFDSTQSAYTATAFYITVNGTTIIEIPLNNVQKTANTTLLVLVTLDISISLPGDLGTLVTQAIQGLFAGVLLNLGCSATANYTIVNQSNGQSSQGSASLSFSSSSSSGFTASGSISYSQYEQVYVTEIVITCSYGNVNASLLSSTYQTSECQSSSGCTLTITVTFTS
jgi:hypothetical protein